MSVVPLLHSYGMTSAMNVPIALGAQMILLRSTTCSRSAPRSPLPPTVFPGVPWLYTSINHAPNVRGYSLIRSRRA